MRDWKDAIFIFAVVTLNAIIGTYQRASTSSGPTWAGGWRGRSRPEPRLATIRGRGWMRRSAADHEIVTGIVPIAGCGHQSIGSLLRRNRRRNTAGRHHLRLTGSLAAHPHAPDVFVLSPERGVPWLEGQVQ